MDSTCWASSWRLARALTGCHVVIRRTSASPCTAAADHPLLDLPYTVAPRLLWEPLVATVHTPTWCLGCRYHSGGATVKVVPLSSWTDRDTVVGDTLALFHIATESHEPQPRLTQCVADQSLGNLETRPITGRIVMLRVPAHIPGGGGLCRVWCPPVWARPQW